MSMFKKVVPGVTLVSNVPLIATDDPEHISYTFYINNISRAVLQELARHRESNFSVKSTRYTLKELKLEKPFTLGFVGEVIHRIKRLLNITDISYNNLVSRAEKYLAYTGDKQVDNGSIMGLEILRKNIANGISNDIAKYNLPESYKTELTWTINSDMLHNFIYLRTDKSALWEIRTLARAIYQAVPDDHKYLYTVR